MNKNYCIITTINPPTKAIEVLYEKFGKNLIIVGDKKTPQNWEYKGIKPIETGGNKKYAPDNSYCRKNLGYMEAIRNKADMINEQDDDTYPNENWTLRTLEVTANESLVTGWFNAYMYFTDTFMWPRGFSLQRISGSADAFTSNVIIYKGNSSIQQGLVDGNPDVDAIWRLTKMKPHYFTWNRSLYLNKDTWCPFNSQSTWWFPKAYPLMYLPVTTTMRMTDIYRSFVAQKCLWELDEGVTFHSPAEVFQDRNPHDLMKDFEDEIPGYLNNEKIVEILSGLTLKNGETYVCENLLTCYEALVDNNILKPAEIVSVLSWIHDYQYAHRDI